MQRSSFDKISSSKFRNYWRNGFTIACKSFLILHVDIDDQVGDHWSVLTLSVAMDSVGLTLYLVNGYENELTAPFVGFAAQY